MRPGYFRDRREAGRLLADKLAHYKNRPDVVVLALPRGGVPVAYEIARAIGAPLDIFLVRKLGIPGYEELAMGAIASGGVRVLNDEVVTGLAIPSYVIESVAAAEGQELARRERVYRGGRPPPDVRGKTVILVDDGLATGSTMLAAVRALRQQQPARIVVAVPTASPDTCEALKGEADEVICGITPTPFQGVGLWYQDFSQTTDEEVTDLLGRGQGPKQEGNPGPRPPGASGQHAEEHLAHVDIGDVVIEGNLTIPEGATAVVLFAHGSGSSRHSSRNRHVARLLNEAKLATLLIDLLTPQEEAIDQRTAHLRFDIGLLARRLVGATDWLRRQPDTRGLRIGYFGASTGAAAALVAAVERPSEVGAVVSRGGRPDLAGPALPRVQAPTLLIVGGNDHQVIELNRMAYEQLRCEKRLVIVPGATHLFEEPGTLDAAAHLAREWFQRYLVTAHTNSDSKTP